MISAFKSALEAVLPLVLDRRDGLAVAVHDALYPGFNKVPLSRLGTERKECEKNEKVPRRSLVI